MLDGWVSENSYYDCFAIASIAKCYPKTPIPSVKVGENNQRAKTNKDKENERSSSEEPLPMQGNPDSRNIPTFFPCGIWKTAQGIWNPINDWSPESKFH